MILAPSEPSFYPMRPINGGRFELSDPKGDGWTNEPKINGWRALVSPHHKTSWNRHGGRLSIECEMVPLINSLPDFEWIDCEFLERRGTGKGILIVLDVPTVKGGYLERREAFNDLPYLPLVGSIPRGVYRLQCMSEAEARRFWTEWDVPGNKLVEGIVSKRLSAGYVRQHSSPSKENSNWVKHRFA